VEHASCDQEPFPAAHPCGEFLCCHGTAGEPQCSNLTERDCLAMEPVGDFSGKWARGLHCSESQYVCPPLACVGATGSCTQPHSTPGCDHWECCVNICRQDYFCCLIEWDSLCLEGTVEGTCEPPPENDRCVGATLLPVPSIATTYSLFADALDETEQACCHNGQPPACYEGRRAGWMCDDHDDCWPGVCQERPLHVSPGLWYKFVATATSAKVHTCQSGAFGTTDSVLVVFAAAESSSAQAACASLTPIGCADDTPGCGPAGKLSEVCVTGLTPGRIYYILVGGKGYEGGEYRLSLSAPCSPTGPPDQPCLDARPK
jgi:hypothetical protein